MFLIEINMFMSHKQRQVNREVAAQKAGSSRERHVEKSCDLVNIGLNCTL